ncbi:MAG: phosphomannomutase/phosphoglucomutase [bacterium]
MNDSVFREYDIRGVYPAEINETMAYTIGKSYGSYIKQKYHQDKCIVSMDNRLSSESLKAYLVNGILDTGVSVIDCGLTTTPMNFFARKQFNLYGIMITASHNPKDDNGFKFSFGGPTNAKGQEIVDFKSFTFANNFLTGKGKYEVADVFEKYRNYLKLGLQFGERRVRAIVDPGNGAASTFIRKILEEYPVDFEIINEASDGNFPNHHPDPADKTNLEQLKARVLETKADIGIAYDGDADRVGFVSNDGKFLSTEEFMILIIRDISYKVSNRTFLYDVKCSKAIEDEIKKLNATPLLYRTGASYTQSKVHEDNLPFGGEFSGHIFFRDRIHDVGSAIYASLRLLELLSKTDKSISDIASDIPKYFITEEIKIPSSDSKKFDVVNKIKKHCDDKNFPLSDIDGIKVFFDEGWALVRASNTGPNLILRTEANTDELKEKLKLYFMKLINEHNVF